MDYDVDYRVVLPDGTVRRIHAVGHPVFSASADLVQLVGTVMDVTERTRAEDERQAHLWFLESMDRVNRAIQGTNDLEQMMSDVLAVGLPVFECDRAWLTYHILSEATTHEEATSKILQAVCDCLVWDLGALWRHDREAGVLRCVEVWHPESIAVPEFEADSRESTLEPRTGLPGRVWSTREPAFIADVVRDPDVLGAPVAGREGLDLTTSPPAITAALDTLRLRLTFFLTRDDFLWCAVERSA